MAKNPKRPKDPVSRAVLIGRILVGEAQDDPAPPDRKSPRAKAAGAEGGKARARALSGAKRSEIAKKAALKRWGNKD